MTTPNPPAGPEMDAKVHALMGLEPERIAIATSDGGKSACAYVSRNGPWYTKQELEAWLKEKQDRGMLTEYVIGEWLRYPHYSTDIAAAFEMEAEIERRGLQNTYVAHLCDVINARPGEQIFSTRSMFWPLAHATPEQRCIAALAALPPKETP